MNDTKLQIQDKVLELLKNQDIHTIKVKTLVDEMGISRSTFYLYYDSIYAVLQELEDEFFEKLNLYASDFWRYPLDKKYLTEPQPSMYNVMKLLNENRRLSTILWGPHGDPVFQAHCKRMIRNQLFPTTIAKAFYPKDTELVVTYKVGGHLDCISYWMQNESSYTPEEMALKQYRLMFKELLNIVS